MAYKSYERIKKGMRIAENGGVRKSTPRIEIFEVTDRHTGSGRTHQVTYFIDENRYTCTCEDFEHHGEIEPCKHIRAVQIEEGRNL